MKGLLYKCGVVVLFAVLLSACVSSVRTTVTTFRGESPVPPDARIAVVAPERVTGAEEFDPLVFDYFKQRTAQHFSDRGYTVVKDAEQADFVASLQYDTVRQKKSDSNSNVYGSVGYRYGYGSVVLMDGYDRDQFEFARHIKLSIAKQNAGDEEPVLSLAAVSYGQCEHLASVFDAMLDAVFEHFDAASGSVSTSSYKSKRPCEA